MISKTIGFRATLFSDPIDVAFQEASGLSNHQDVELIGSRYDGLRPLQNTPWGAVTGRLFERAKNMGLRV